MPRRSKRSRLHVPAYDDEDEQPGAKSLKTLDDAQDAGEAQAQPSSIEERQILIETLPDGTVVRHGYTRFTAVDEEVPIEADAMATHQMIFDRLPISQTARKELYLWLLEQHESDQKTKQACAEGRCPLDQQPLCAEGFVRPEPLGGEGSVGCEQEPGRDASWGQ